MYNNSRAIMAKLLVSSMRTSPIDFLSTLSRMDDEKRFGRFGI